MSGTNNSEILELLSRYFVGDLSKEELTELSNMLRNNKQARDRFRLMADVDAELRYVASELDLENGPVVASFNTFEQPVKYRRSRWKWIGIAAAILLLAGAAWLVFPMESGKVETSGLRDTSMPIAVLSASHQSEFAEGRSPERGLLDVGSYELLVGAITVDFRTGVSVAIEGPAKFDILNDMKMTLSQGRVWAVVDKSGEGFVIETPEVEIEDLGTEFGVYVDGERSELHVFAGEVNVHHDKEPTELVRETQGLSWDNGLKESLDANFASFTSSESIGYQRWLNFSKQLRQDESCVFYSDFEKRAVVENLSENSEVSDGNVRGSIWATGRWPQKGSLLFERKGDRVDLEIPGNYQQVTIMGWVLLHRLDEPLTALFNTEGYEAGEHHWNLTRQGRYNIGVSGQYHDTFDQQVLLGKWTHVTAVLNFEESTATYYMDGKIVGVVKTKTSEPVCFGRCSIGSWGDLTDEGVEFVREFRGRIDEFSLFSRAFSSDEIESVYIAGSHF